MEAQTYQCNSPAPSCLKKVWEGGKRPDPGGGVDMESRKGMWGEGSGERWRGGVGTFQNQHPFREMITVDYLKEILGKAPNSRKSHSLGKRLQ